MAISSIARPITSGPIDIVNPGFSMLTGLRRSEHSSRRFPRQGCALPRNDKTGGAGAYVPKAPSSEGLWLGIPFWCRMYYNNGVMSAVNGGIFNKD